MSATITEDKNSGDSVCRSSRRSCAVCQSEQNLKRCSRCKITFYCCRNHQKTDWIRHKNVCLLSDSESESRKDGRCKDSRPQPTSLYSSGSSGVSRSSRPCEEMKDNTEGELGDRSEIESILDFRSLRIQTHPSSHSSTDSTESKAIFSDLQNSDVVCYTGPSDDIAVGEMRNAQDSSDLNSALRENEISGMSCNPSSNGEEDLSVTCSQQMNDIENERNTIVPEEPGQPSFNWENSIDSHPRTDSENPNSVHETLIPLDPRPLRKLKFPLPESYEYKDLAKFISLRLINLGYCILDELFDDDLITGMLAEFKDLYDLQKSVTEETTSASHNDQSGAKQAGEDGIKWIEGEEGLSFTSKGLLILDSIMEVINPSLSRHSRIEGRTKAKIRFDYGNGKFYRRCVDNPNKDGRRITCILYLDKDWDVVRDGGLLRIIRPHLDKPIDIPPKANRLVFMWSDNRNPYEVHPVYRHRFSLTMWYFDSNEMEEAKIHKLKTETDEISAKIAELEQKKRDLEEVTGRQQIQNKAMEAVRSLSQEELEAISVLIYNHPQPAQVMTAMGIAPSIQEALVLHLANL